MDGRGIYHTAVLLKEAVDGLDIQPAGVYVDATFGAGGHSREILSRLGDQGRVFAFDQDRDAGRNSPEDGRLILIEENFRHMGRFLRAHGLSKVDGILADLGVSSHQFDQGDRGFSTRWDGPLDMRMDRRNALTAKEVLETYGEKALQTLFEQYGSVRNARTLAAHIVRERARSPLDSTASFKAMLTPCVKGNPHRYLAQVFQAIRMEVNDEIGALKELLMQAADWIRPGGRLAVISFHSLEDRIVKQFIKQGGWEARQTDFYGNPERKPTFTLLPPGWIAPSAQEVKANPRARSARLRLGLRNEEAAKGEKEEKEEEKGETQERQERQERKENKKAVKGKPSTNP